MTCTAQVRLPRAPRLPLGDLSPSVIEAQQLRKCACKVTYEYLITIVAKKFLKVGKDEMDPLGVAVLLLHCINPRRLCEVTVPSIHA